MTGVRRLTPRAPAPRSSWALLSFASSAVGSVVGSAVGSAFGSVGHIRGEPPFRILDLGCGPGRDLVAFRALGHAPVGLDGALRFCEMARALSGCEVLHQDMLALELPPSRFDGVFANASLFHVPTRELPRVLAELRDTLVPGGVLFASNPRGDNTEGWHDDRYGAYHDHTRWTALVTAQGFAELEHYYRPPGQPRHLQPWLATIYRKT
jgi:SAM-dependent methyltransferase